ncbi:MAG TPA: response regulator transcription factor [Rhodocyclaceae bacterium]|nr:response regulator transcription factor [Rhodocyclaceae bacterium]
MTRKVLVIEDDPDIARLVKLQLGELSCAVTLAADGPSGLAAFETKPFDLVILDLMLPGIDGLELCRRIRARPGYTPILMLTARSGEIDRVLGLEMGADDYVTKPFSVLELVARVKAIFRRVDSLASRAEASEQVIDNGALTIDIARREVRLAGRPVELTATEFDLLLHFARHPGRVFSRTQLLDQVWGYSHSGYEHTVNSHINRLRAKIEANPNQPEFIQTVWGVGYKFRDATRRPDAP